MLIETCTNWHDKYVQIDYTPKPEWKDKLQNFFHKWFDERHSKVLLAWSVCITFVDKRKDIPTDCDKRKVVGGYRYIGDNSCEIVLWSKGSQTNLNHALRLALKCIKKDLVDEDLHFNAEGHACHCSTGRKRLKEEKKLRRLSHE